MTSRLIFISVMGQLVPLLLFYWILRRTTEKHSPSRRIGYALLIAEPIIFSAFLLLHLFGRTEEGLPYSLSPFSSLYVFIGYVIGIYGLGELALYLFHRLRGKCSTPDMAIRRWILRLSVPIALCLCIWGYHNFDHPRVTHYDIALPPLPQRTEPLRIVLVTDIHIGDIITAERVEKLAQMVHAQNPDYILIGGDVIDYHFMYADKADVHLAMSHLCQDRDKVFFVLGNHEHYTELDAKTKWLQSFGQLLIDRYVELEPGLFLIGRDDKFNTNRPPLQQVMQGIPSDALTLLLDHSPTTPDEVRANGIDLSMHGHTHAGQLFPSTVIVRMMHERAYGHYHRGQTHHVISSGYGLSTTPLRIGTHSEIVVLDLTFGNHQ